MAPNLASISLKPAATLSLSVTSYVRLLKKLKEERYKLHLFFLWIPGPQLAIERIKERVSEGGHDVPVQDIRRRFDRSIANFFKLYQPLLDSWIVFNNSDIIPTLIAKSKDGKLFIFDGQLFNNIDKSGELK